MNLVTRRISSSTVVASVTAFLVRLGMLDGSGSQKLCAEMRNSQESSPSPEFLSNPECFVAPQVPFRACLNETF